MRKLKNDYQYILGVDDMPEFLKKYLEVPSLKRLQNVGYFCGMDYASKDIYNIREYVSRYDHSINVAMITYKLTHNKTQTIAALFHDISTPCFSHVIDYMNNDYVLQESTEEKTEEIILNDNMLLSYLKSDNIDPKDIINFKQYTIVDNKRPKLCADRLDGILTPGLFLTKNLNLLEVQQILASTSIMVNEDGENEICFNNQVVLDKVNQTNEKINKLFTSNLDNYMMNLLALITKNAIEKGLMTYDDLYYLDERQLINILLKSRDIEIISLLYTFQNVTKNDIPTLNPIEIKEKKLDAKVRFRR